MNARESAFLSLQKYENSGVYSNIELSYAIERGGLEGAEKALYTALFYGVIERKLTLDHYISLLSDREDIDLNVRIILRMGLYQLIYMTKIPESAAVNESVKLATRFYARKNSENFINAVLRNYIRKKDSLKLPDAKKEPYRHLSVKYSVPEWICRLWSDAYGAENTERILETVNAKPTLTLSVNTLRVMPAALCEALNLSGIKAQLSPISKNSILLDGAVPMSALEPFEGQYFVQDETSALCVAAMDAKEGDAVLDACACPGGKSFGMAMAMRNTGKIYARDLHKNKLSLIETGAEKLGITVIETGVQNASVHNPEMPQFDKILCDVPCSGLGVIAQKPDIKRKNPSDIERLPTVQAAILCESAKHLKSGGVLVYSTCTLNPRENADVVDAFLAENKDFSLVPFEVGGVRSDGKAELFPHIHKTNGFFIAKMKKA